ncbi:hypothetical protein JCM16358_07040 [Halanaerocella petrolearia]
MYIDLNGVKERMAERQIFINRLQMMNQNSVERELEKEVEEHL